MNTNTARFMLLAAAALTIVHPASAASTATRVTPANLSTFSVGFTVTARTTGRGTESTEYEVIVHRKVLDPVRFTRPMQGELAQVTQMDGGFRFEGARAVKVKRLGRDQLVFRFTATPEEVSRLSFGIGFPDYTIINGKRQWMPSADFYYLNLRDFATKK